MTGALLYLTSPAPGRFVVNLQPEGWSDAMQYEVSEDQLGNFVGAYLALKRQSSNRVPYKTREHRVESADGSTGRQPA
jgi:hypothetical protein